MAKKTTSRSGKSKPRGKKGGVSIGTPEVVGAVTGAAIGGVTGLMLANQKTRKNLATVKDRALNTAGNIMENVNVDTQGLKETTQDLTDEAKKKVDKNLPK